MSSIAKQRCSLHWQPRVENMTCIEHQGALSLEIGCEPFSQFELGIENAKIKFLSLS